MADSPVGASSATYRTAVNEIADAIKTDPRHTKYPSHDLFTMIDGIPEAMRAKAIEWYERGIKRGMQKATDLMAEGTIYKTGGIVHAPRSITIKTKIKVAGGEWEKFETEVQDKDIGFE